MWFNIDLIILILFLIVNFVVGFGVRKKLSINDFQTYSLGNFKDISVLFVTAAFASFFISGGIFINLLQQSYNTGISYVLKNSIFQPLAYGLIAFFIIPLHKNLKKGSVTLNEWIDKELHSSFLRALIGLSEFLLHIGLLAIQFKAFGTIAKALFNLPPQYESLCVIGFAIFLCIYTAKGGFVAITLTDILQFWVFVVAFICLVVFVAFKSNFFAGVWDKGVIENPRMAIGNCFKDFTTTMFTLSIWIETLLPKFSGPRYQKAMMSDDSKTVKKGVVCAAGVFAFFMISCVCISLLMYSQNPNLKVTEIIPFFVSNYCPTGLRGLLGAGLFAMTISTAEAISNSNSIVLTNDIIPFCHKMFSKKTYRPSIFMTRISLLLVCGLSVFISLKMTNIFSILILFDNFYCPVAMIPSIVLALGLNVKKASVMSGVLCGILVTVIDQTFTNHVSSCFVGAIANLIGLVLAEFVLRLRSKKDNVSTNVEK